ncbi:MAG: type III-A CRISPR-associated protein Csm2 [Lachnospirales bacterium]
MNNNNSRQKQNSGYKENTKTRPNFANIAEEAEWVIKSLVEKHGKNVVKTNQIRKILTIVNSIDAKHSLTQDAQIDSDVEDMLINLKIKIAYQSGREPAVKSFIKTSKLDSKLDEVLKSKSSKALKEYIKYTEALVAYHKFHVKEK